MNIEEVFPGAISRGSEIPMTGDDNQKVPDRRAAAISFFLSLAGLIVYVPIIIGAAMRVWSDGWIWCPALLSASGLLSGYLSMHDINMGQTQGRDLALAAML